MAGTDPRFPSAQFRAAIKFAARMGFPNAVEVQPTFRWDTTETYSRADASGRPWSFTNTETPTSTGTVSDLVVDAVVAVVEKGEETPEGTRAGMFRGSKMTLTILDDEMATIRAHGGGRFADAVMVGDTEYRCEEIPKPDSLFDVDVWTVHAFAASVAKPA